MNQTILRSNERVAVTGRLEEMAALASEQARRQHRPVLVSSSRQIVRQSAIEFFLRGRLVAHDRAYWEQPRNGLIFAAVGAAHTFGAPGSERFRAVDNAWCEFLSGALVDSDDPERGPILLGGFSFDPAHPQTSVWSDFPEALMILPRHLLTITNNGTWITTNIVIWPDSDLKAEVLRSDAECETLLSPSQVAPALAQQELALQDVRPATEWQETVRAAAAEIHARKLEKVVLAREVIVRSAEPFNIGLTLRRLRAGYPDCYVFAFARGERVFIGASPERLAGAHAGEVQVTCLAGSSRRGATPAEDEELGRKLLASAKNRHEHEVVSRMLRAALEKVCVSVEGPTEPQLLKLSNVQHLYTPLRGRLTGDTRLLEVIEMLHPTPAVGGMPREAALALIREHEGMDRGWYAAPVGWLDAAGGGEFVVGLRSGLIDGSNARLFAGCGIVADSDPAAEYEESRLKLKPMLGALAGS